MKRIVPFILSITFVLPGFGQDFFGLATGNYAGVSGVHLQPASIVDSRHKFDINLIGTDLYFSNNFFLLDKKLITNFKKSSVDNWSNFKDQYITTANLGSGEKVYANLNNRTQMPLSFMATLSKNSAIALTLNNRSFIQANDFSTDFARLAYNNFNPINGAAQTIANNNYDFNAMNWAEAGLTYGRVLLNNDKHFVKAAITGKYLAGIQAMQSNATNFTLGVNTDSTFNLVSNRVNYRHNAGVDAGIVFDKSFKPSAKSWGLDMGVVYEFRGNADKFKYLVRKDEKSYTADRRDVNKYIFKVGASLVDVGRFTFDKGANVRDFSANIADWDIKGAQYSSLAAFDAALASRTTSAPNQTNTFTASLPTALSLQFDLKLFNGFFLNAMSYTPVSVLGKSDIEFNNFGYYAITPRFEGRAFGLYLPYTFNDHKNITGYRNNNLGATLRLGPLFVGSSNLGTALFNNELKALNAHVGVKIGFTHGKPNKTTQLLEKLSGKQSTDSVMPMPIILDSVKQQSLISNIKVDTTTKPYTTYITKPDTVKVTTDEKPTRVIDYKAGTITDTGKEGSVIIVNNHYYYGNTPQTDSERNQIIVSEKGLSKADIRTTPNNVTETNNLQWQKDSIALVQRNLESKEMLRSNEAKLDSLTRKLNQLQATVQNANATNNLDQLKQTNTELTNLINELRRQNADLQRLMQRNENQFQQNQEYYQRQFRQQQNRIEALQQELRSLEKKNSELKLDKGLVLDQYNTLKAVTPATNPVVKRDTVIIEKLVEATPQVVRDTVLVKQTTAPVVVRDTVLKVVESAPIVVKTETAFNPATLPEEVVLFDVGKASVKPVYHKRLTYLAGLMKQHRQIMANITGHTDATGSLAINQRLSQERAQAVKTFFLNKGVDANRLIIRGVADNEPFTDGTDKVANSQNRRVTIKLN